MVTDWSEGTQDNYLSDLEEFVAWLRANHIAIPTAGTFSAAVQDRYVLFLLRKVAASTGKPIKIQTVC